MRYKSLVDAINKKDLARIISMGQEIMHNYQKDMTVIHDAIKTICEKTGTDITTVESQIPKLEEVKAC